MKRILSVLLASTVAISLVACSSSSSSSVSSADSTTAAAEETNSAAQETEPQGDIEEESEAEIAGDSEGSAQIDVINVGISADITNYFPWQSRGSGGWEAVIGGIYQTLLDYYPETDSYEPALMKSYTMADDGLSMDCEIFDYIYDSEGNHITADDVVFSFGMTYDTFSDVRDMAKEIIKTGDYTFTLVFNRPLRLGEFMYMTNWSIVSQAAYEASDDEMHSDPVGTGPYKLVSHTDGYSLTYERVENYWQTDPDYANPRDQHNVKTINWYVISESSQRAIALEQGTIDICAYVDSSDLDRFRGDGYSIYSYPSILAMTLFPNCDESSPLNDINLRLAVCYAISNQGILNSVYGGDGQVLYDCGPEWSVNYDPDWSNGDNYYHYNTDTAKEYLEKSSYNGENLVIICQSDENSTNTAQIIQNFLLQINVNTSIEAYESSTFSEYIKDPGKWDLMVCTNAVGNSNYLSAIEGPMFAESYSWGGSKNFIYDDDLQEILNTALQGDASKEDIQALRDYMMDNCYMMGLVTPNTNVVLPENVTDVVLSKRNTIMPGACTYK